MMHEFIEKHKCLIDLKKEHLSNLINIRETGVMYKSLQFQAILKMCFTRVLRKVL